MLTKIEVEDVRVFGTPLSMEIGNASSAPIQIRNVEGLGPVKASVNTSQFGSSDGEGYHGSLIGKRNIVLTLGLNPDWVEQTVTSLRQLLYGYFMTKQAIKLRFFDDTYPTCEILGYVESNEPNHFGKDPEVQISVICPQPDFVGIDPIVVTDAVTISPVNTIIPYAGTVSTGFSLEIATSEVGIDYSDGFTIIKFSTLPNQFMQLDAIGVDDTHKIQISTLRGQKYVRQLDTVTDEATSILQTMQPSSGWPFLEPGSNSFRVTSFAAEPGDTGMEWTLTYYNRFGGL